MDSVRSIIFLFLFFCLEATLGQDTYESSLRHCYSNIFESAISKIKVSSQQMRDTLTTAF